MLRSLFGDLYPLRDQRSRDEAENDFAVTAILEDDDSQLGSSGHLVDRHVRDLFVTGSPAQAMRAHFASTRDDDAAGERSPVITLFDPSQMWAAGVLKALADAGGQIIERLHLRDQSKLNTLAMIERTTLPRRGDDTLKVYHADVRAEGTEALSIPLALLERSDLAVVIVGPMHANALQELLDRLGMATLSDNWRCPQLLFLCPVGAGWVADKIRATSWPANVQVQALTESLPSASVVWNLLLSHWNVVKQDLASNDSASTSPASASAIASAISSTTATATAPNSQSLAPPTPQAATLPAAALLSNPAPLAETSIAPRLNVPAAAPQNPARALVVLQELMLLDGLIFAALVNAESGRVIASEGRGPDIDRASVAAAEILRTHRRTLRQMGHWRPNDPVDEILVTAGSRYHILRTLQAHPDQFILAVLDKLRSNLAMTRFRIMEAQQVLG